MRKKLMEILDAVCEATDEGKALFLFQVKGAKKADFLELKKKGLVKEAGKKKMGWKATKKGFDECGYE